ncbi:hypothetical protein TSMEX_004519 [Taenia solium]|eukprot:TsM_000234400 transcript=TsM_000234400 gene=TsM_000234400
MGVDGRVCLAGELKPWRLKVKPRRLHIMRNKHSEAIKLYAGRTSAILTHRETRFPTTKYGTCSSSHCSGSVALNPEKAGTMNCGSPKNASGFYEFIPEDGSIVDLTQPGLFSRRQLVAIFRRRGFDCLLSTIHPDTNSLIRAYYDHIIPLPCRNRTKPSTLPPINQKVDQIQRLPSSPTSRNLKHERQIVPSATQRLKWESGTPSTSLHREKRQKNDLDKLIIISNPNWPTSGVTSTLQNSATTPEEVSKSSHHGKRPSPSSSPLSVLSPPPLKRPKINRNFANLATLKCNGKQPT